MPLRKIKHVRIEGTPRKRGKMYGKQAKEEIQKSITFYENLASWFGYTLNEVARDRAKPIYKYSQSYYEELKGVAEGADVPFNSIIAVNARTEIKSLFENECTAAYAPKSTILAQNWDWGADAEDHIIILDITYPNGLTITTMTEAGMLAKIGFNSEGIGVCLNALRTYKERSGIPIHAILRRVLEAKTLKEAKRIALTIETNTAGNILIANDVGEYVNVEIAHKKRYIHTDTNSIYVHTNHYLATNITNTSLDIHQSSLHRYKRSKHLANQTGSKRNVLNILHDTEHSTYPILREYHDNDSFGKYGTVLTVVMNLQKRTFQVTDGYPVENPSLHNI